MFSTWLPKQAFTEQAFRLRNNLSNITRDSVTYKQLLGCFQSPIDIRLCFFGGFSLSLYCVVHCFRVEWVKEALYIASLKDVLVLIQIN